MNCPVCAQSRRELTESGVTIDFCDGCKGTWFDNCEIKKFDESHEPLSILKEIAFAKQELNTENRHLKCPRCIRAYLVQHFYTYKHETRIDTCPHCAGIWLDAGELISMRNELKSEAQNRAELKAFADKISESILQELVQKNVHITRSMDTQELHDRISNFIRRAIT